MFVENEETLNKFDSESGDGDCGSTFKRAAQGQSLTPLQLHDCTLLSLVTVYFAAILKDIEQIPCSRPADFLLFLARVADEAMGGSSGAVCPKT